MIRPAIVLALVALLAAANWHEPFAQTIQADSVRVVDGDTIVLDGNQRVRIFGIDAPESSQRCTDASGQPYNCGSLATSALEQEIGPGKVSCDPVDTDRYRRTVAICTVDGRDLGETMVRLGMAVDYAQYSGGVYADAEREAREAKRGIWAGAFINPRQWRQEHPRR